MDSTAPPTAAAATAAAVDAATPPAATTAVPSPSMSGTAPTGSAPHNGLDEAVRVASESDALDNRNEQGDDEDDDDDNGDEDEDDEEEVLDELDLYFNTATIATAAAVYAPAMAPHTSSPVVVAAPQQQQKLQQHQKPQQAADAAATSRAVSSRSSSSLHGSKRSELHSPTRVSKQDVSLTDTLEMTMLQTSPSPPLQPAPPYTRDADTMHRQESGTHPSRAPPTNTAARGPHKMKSRPPSQHASVSPPSLPLSPALSKRPTDPSHAATQEATGHDEAGPYVSPLMAEFDGELLDLIKAYYVRKHTATTAAAAAAAAVGTTALFATPPTASASPSHPPAVHVVHARDVPSSVAYLDAAAAASTPIASAGIAQASHRGRPRGMQEGAGEEDSSTLLTPPALPFPRSPPLLDDVMQSTSTTGNEASVRAWSRHSGGPLHALDVDMITDHDRGADPDRMGREPADSWPACSSPQGWTAARDAAGWDAATSTSTTSVAAAAAAATAAALATAASSAAFRRRLSSSMVPSFDASAAAVVHGVGTSAASAGSGSFGGTTPRHGLSGIGSARSPLHSSPFHHASPGLESRQQMPGVSVHGGSGGGVHGRLDGGWRGGAVGPGSGGVAGGSGALGGGIAQSLSNLSSLPTYSSTSFVRAYVSDVSLSLEPAILVSALTAALNIVVVYFLQQHVLDTRDHLGLFLIGSYMVFSSYYMIYYFLERFSASFRRIASQDKKFYIIGNLIKAGILISITPFACVHLVKIIVLDEWEGNILRNLGCIYAIPDFISMVIVRRMRWSTWVHHACVVVFNYFSIMNNYTHENVCRCVVVYAAFSSFAYCVNVLLASRFLGVSVKVARVLSYVALTVYALCCAVNWAWQVYYLRRLLTRGHEHWTVYLYMLLISLVMWDDVVLNKWLLHHARNNAYAAAQHQQHQRRRQQQQQQQQQQGQPQPVSPHPPTLSPRPSASLAAALPPHLSPQATQRTWSQDGRVYTTPATGLPPRAP